MRGLDAVARRRVVLPGGAVAPTPLVRKVRKNVSAYRLSTAFAGAGEALRGIPSKNR